MSEPAHIPATGHELVDAPVRPILLAASVVALTIVFAFVVSVGVFRFFAARTIQAPSNPMAAKGPEFPPAPRLEVNGSIELDRMRAEEDRILSTYGWIDRKTGTARIPIDRAIDLQLRRGFAVRKEASPK